MLSSGDVGADRKRRLSLRASSALADWVKGECVRMVQCTCEAAISAFEGCLRDAEYDLGRSRTVLQP